MALETPTVYLPNKLSSDVLDYAIDFTKYVPAGVELSTVNVEVIASGTGESPLELDVVGEAQVGTNRKGKASLCAFWLGNGTPRTRYRLELTGTDNQHADPARHYSIYAEIYITG